MLAKVLGKMGAPIKSREMMNKEVVQAVSLYVRKIWVVPDAMITVLEGFNHMISRQIAGMTSRKGDSWEWEWA